MSKESIKEIDSRLKMAEDAEREQLMKVYAPDDRAGVQKLLEKYRKQKEKLLAETGTHPGAMKDAVTSPAGTTIAGVRTLEEKGFRAAAMDAVIAAYERTLGLSK